MASCSDVVDVVYVVGCGDANVDGGNKVRGTVADVADVAGVAGDGRGRWGNAAEVGRQGGAVAAPRGRLVYP